MSARLAPKPANLQWVPLHHSSSHTWKWMLLCPEYVPSFTTWRLKGIYWCVTFSLFFSTCSDYTSCELCSPPMCYSETQVSLSTSPLFHFWRKSSQAEIFKALDLEDTCSCTFCHTEKVTALVFPAIGLDLFLNQNLGVIWLPSSTIGTICPFLLSLVILCLPPVFTSGQNRSLGE